MCGNFVHATNDASHYSKPPTVINVHADGHPSNGRFQDNLGQPAPERQTILDFNEATVDAVAVHASAGPYANHLHFAPCQHLITHFTGRYALPDAQPTLSEQGRQILT